MVALGRCTFFGLVGCTFLEFPRPSNHGVHAKYGVKIPMLESRGDFKEVHDHFSSNRDGHVVDFQPPFAIELPVLLHWHVRTMLCRE